MIGDDNKAQEIKVAMEVIFSQGSLYLSNSAVSQLSVRDFFTVDRDDSFDG